MHFLVVIGRLALVKARVLHLNLDLVGIPATSNRVVCICNRRCDQSARVWRASHIHNHWAIIIVVVCSGHILAYLVYVVYLLRSGADVVALRSLGSRIWHFDLVGTIDANFWVRVVHRDRHAGDLCVEEFGHFRVLMMVVVVVVVILLLRLLLLLLVFARQFLGANHHVSTASAWGHLVCTR